MQPLKLVIFDLVQRHFADIVRCVAFCNIDLHIIMNTLNGFQMIDDLERRMRVYRPTSTTSGLLRRYLVRM